MSDDRALFVPRNMAGAYNCAVEIVKVGTGCLVFLRPQPGGSFVDKENLQLLMGIDLDWIRADRPFWVGKTQVRKRGSKEEEVEFVRDWKVLNFEESVNFMAGLSAFKRV